MSALQEAFDARLKYTHFRILVIGRANAGKTTLLKRVCNTDEEPCIYDEKNNNLVSASSLSVGNFSSEDIPGGSNRRSGYLNLTDRIYLSEIDPLSAGSTISTAHSLLRATRNSFSTILQVLRPEAKHRLSKSKPSLRNAPSRRKYMINSMLYGQSAVSGSFSVLDAYALCVAAGIALS